MLMLKKELMLCLIARGHEDAPGFEDAAQPLTEQEQKGIRERLIGHKLLEENGDGQTGWRFSALGQVILDTVGIPDAWLEIRSESAGIHRRIYIRDAFYICLEEDHGMLMISMLPSLPLVIGGYASALKGIPADALPEEPLETAWENSRPVVSIRCNGAELVMEAAENGVVRKMQADEAVYSRFCRENCTNEITAWLLASLKERGNR